MYLFRYIVPAVFAILGSSGIAKDDGGVQLFSFGATGSRSQGMEINAAAVQLLRSDTDSIQLDSLPLITGSVSDFHLVPLPIFAPDATIEFVRDNGTTMSAPAPDIKTWYGIDPDNNSRALFLSANADGAINVMVTGDAQTSVTVISPDSSGAPDSYRIVPANIPDKDFCNTLDFPVDPERELSSQSTSPQESSREDLLLELEMMVDVGHNLYFQLGQDDTKVLNYLVDLFGAVNSIYQRDVKVRFSLTHVVIWTTPDPFTRTSDPVASPTTFDQLDNYRSYINPHRYGVRRDLAHFLDHNPGLGGVAWLNVLGSDGTLYRNAVSNLDANRTIPDLNSYFWDTAVVAHEIGHNVGTPHTHCYTPPIDCCFNECEKDCPEEVPATGTIMSYCHLNGSVEMRFHDRVRQYLRYLAELSPILSIYADQPNLVVKGVDDILAMPGAIHPGPGTTLKAMSVGGAATAVSFRLLNNGTQSLSLTGTPFISLEGSSMLSLVSQPETGSLAPGESTTFVLQYDPISDDVARGTIMIRSNDADTPAYQFVVEGRIATPSAPITTTFTGNQPIAEANGEWTIIPLAVTGIPGMITDVDFRFNGTDCLDPEKVGLLHSFVGDLEIRLVSPMGTAVTLMNRPGAGDFGVRGANFCHTRFDDDLSKPLIENITTGDAPYSGIYRPNEPLSAFFGQNGNGQWHLHLYDWASPHTGTVQSFSIIIRGEDGVAAADDWTLFN